MTMSRRTLLQSALMTLAGAIVSPVSAFPGRALSGTTAKRPLLLAHYMPWFEARPDSRQWGWHWTMNRFDPDQITNGKRAIASHYYPLIGPYDSGDPAVIVMNP